MRSDMAKVVTERPRAGHSNPSLKTSMKIHRDRYEDDDHGSTRHPISRKRQYGWHAKEFTDLLGPLRNYLHKQIGRPWNTVFSELCEHLDRRSLTGLHIWGHVKSEVSQHVYFKDGVPYEKSGWRYGPWRVRGLYVHPSTGLICLAPKYKPHPTKPVPTVKKLDELKEFHNFNGIWYYLEYEMQPDYYHEFNRVTETIVKKRRKQDKKVLIKKQQLSSKQLIEHKLKNTPEIRQVSRKVLRAISSKVRASGS